ncbi:hypothetical protein [Agarivorans sp. QJM3NY_25]|uniref:hypothetical protein n=1 Tax=Agarivorans sp. QJM3NY_25 TaxID=3421430 RepID=UPI003D7DFEE6
MATDMAMDTRKNKALSIVVALIVGLSMSVSAADFSFLPKLSAELVYTDNVGLTEDATRSGQIGVFTAGLESEFIGHDGRLTLDYQAEQIYNSDDSDKNKLYHDLIFMAEKKIRNTGVTVGLVSKMYIMPAKVNDNAITDVVTGDLIQGSSHELSLGYKSNPRKWIDLNTAVFSTFNRYEDDRGNNNDLEGALLFKNGQKVKNVTWLVESAYSKREARANSAATETLKYKIELGLPPRSGFSPFLRYYAESYLEGVNASSTVGESESWGPALRYFRTQLSYLEVSYNFSLEREKNDDYIGAALNLQPNRRTKLLFEYGQRFYGDAYSFTFSHERRRIKTDISYIEEPTSFDRRFFVEGDILAEQKLNKTLRWNSALDLHRSGIDFEIRHQDRTSLTELTDFIQDKTYGVGLGLDHKLTRQLRAAFKVDYDYYRFERISKGKQVDKYSRYNLSLTQDLIEGFSLIYRYQFTRRSSSIEGRDYNENRVSINATKQF